MVNVRREYRPTKTLGSLMLMKYEDNVYRSLYLNVSITAIDDDAMDSISIPVATRRYILPL